MGMTKVLIVDDSALMRRHLTQIFETAGGFEIATARDGLDALRAVKDFQPDVITLDINMPQMDGMTCLSHIMVEDPRPVVMVSSITQAEALPTLEALALGAVDYVAKPGGTVSLNLRAVEKELVAKTRQAATSRVRRARTLVARLERHQPRQPSSNDRPRPEARSSTVSAPIPKRNEALPRPSGKGDEQLILIGVSTGGPRALEDVLPKLPQSLPYAVLVSVHMPPTFTGYFAQRMGELCELPVHEVQRQMPVEDGHIYIAKGETDLLTARRGGRLVVLPAPTDASLLWHPSVERMVLSALAQVDARNLIGVQLTGMGYDGASAMALLRQHGGHTIAESEETAVVFGMPKELIERGGAEVILPIERVAQQLETWTKNKDRR